MGPDVENFGLVPSKPRKPDNAIRVLDHGLVRLVDHMGSDLSVVRSARVSYDAEWRAGEDEGKDEKLIGYLWKNQHTTPFESVSFTFEIKAPIFVFRQWHRHRTWSYNEVSARYSMLPAEMYVPRIQDMGTQSKHNKQMRDIDPDMTADELQKAERMVELIKMTNEAAYYSYENLIKQGAPRELARGVLPVNTYSHMFGTVNLLNLLKFIRLRDHEHAQYEVQVYARAMLELIKPLVPVSVAAFEASR